ncbi:MAG: hypothetical protein HKP41_16235 [Desulfobacterales bacterium]|nr:hypothetical protein [Desulfobacterales bacterium]
MLRSFAALGKKYVYKMAIDEVKMEILKRVYILFALSLLPVSVSFGQVESFIFQGVDRQYRIHNEQAASEGTAPVVVHLHGLRNRERMEKGRETLDLIGWKPLEETAVKNGFVLVQPAAYWGQWNLFTGLDNTRLDNGEEFDDIGYVFGVVDKLIREGLADRKRIYVSGISDGATMLVRLLCHPDSPFAAAVHLVGSMPESYQQDCNPARPTPFMAIAGTTDRILFYDGRIYPYGRSLSIPELMEFWRLKHGCTGQAYELLPDRDPDDSSRVVSITWNGCTIDGAVKQLRVEGGGHAVPGFNPVPDSRRERWGGHNRDIESAVEVWKFVNKFTMSL